MVTFLVSLSMTLASAVALLAFLVYRKLALEADLKDCWWRVKWSEIKFADKQSSGRKSMTSLASASQATLSSTGMATTITRGSTGSAASSMNTTCANISGVLVGIYKVHS